MRYQISGTVMQTVEIDLSPGDTVYSQTHAMAWMTDGVNMHTNTGGGCLRASSAASRAAVSSSPTILVNGSAPRSLRTAVSRIDLGQRTPAW